MFFLIGLIVVISGLISFFMEIHDARITPGCSKDDHLDEARDSRSADVPSLTTHSGATPESKPKAGGDLEQCTARLLKIQGLKPEVYLDPAFGLIPTRNNRRNARWN